MIIINSTNQSADVCRGASSRLKAIVREEALVLAAFALARACVLSVVPCSECPFHQGQAETMSHISHVISYDVVHKLLYRVIS